MEDDSEIIIVEVALSSENVISVRLSDGSTRMLTLEQVLTLESSVGPSDKETRFFAG